MNIVSQADDIDYANGTETRADRTVRLEWDGAAVELDLTRQHIKEVDQLIGHLLRIGRPVKAHKQAPRGGSASRPNARGYLKGLRAWADALGRTTDYTTPGGHWSYPKALRQEYDAFLAGQAQ